MSKELFEQIVNSGFLGTALLAIAVALWIVTFRALDGKSLFPKLDIKPKIDP